MERRKFVHRSLLAGTALITPFTAVFSNSKIENKPSDETPFHLNYGIHDGTFKNIEALKV